MFLVEDCFGVSEDVLCAAGEGCGVLGLGLAVVMTLELVWMA